MPTFTQTKNRTQMSGVESVSPSDQWPGLTLGTASDASTLHPRAPSCTSSALLFSTDAMVDAFTLAPDEDEDSVSDADEEEKEK